MMSRILCGLSLMAIFAQPAIKGFSDDIPEYEQIMRNPQEYLRTLDQDATQSGVTEGAKPAFNPHEFVEMSRTEASSTTSSEHEDIKPAQLSSSTKSVLGLMFMGLGGGALYAVAQTFKDNPKAGVIPAILSFALVAAGVDILADASADQE